MTRNEARARVQRAKAEAGHVDRWDEAMVDLLVQADEDLQAVVDAAREVTRCIGPEDVTFFAGDVLRELVEALADLDAGERT